jgi:hypothetical protein
MGEELIRIGVMTKTQVDDVLARQKSGDKRLFGEIAISLGYINNEALRSCLSTESGCRFRLDCHFHNTKEKIVFYVQLKKFYCDEWPQKCAIYQQKVAGNSVPTTLLPTDTPEEIREP